MKCSSLAALEVVKVTTSSAASDENFDKMTTFLFQCVFHLNEHMQSLKFPVEVTLNDV